MLQHGTPARTTHLEVAIMDLLPGRMYLASACSTVAQHQLWLHSELMHTRHSSPEVTVLTEKSSFTDSDTVGAVKEASVCIATCTDTGVHLQVQYCRGANGPSRTCVCLLGVSCCGGCEGGGPRRGHPQAREQQWQLMENCEH